ncbi:MAG: hypothetical protein ACREHC_06625 [Candidatus Levyibacteriota bacterium]
MAFNPFSNDSEDTSFEQGNAINQSAKNAVKAVTVQAQQQQKALTKSIVDQLYGVTPPSPDKNSQQKEKPPGMETIEKQMTQNPGDEKQLEEARKKLQEFQRLHKDTYFNPTLGDGAQKKQEQEQQQKKQLKLQEEEEERQAKAEEKAAQEESLAAAAAPRGKNTGRNRMSKPIALTQAKTKTEINRGTSG